MTLTTTHPNPYTMRELNSEAAAHAEAQARRRATHLPFYIIAKANYELTAIRPLARNGKCIVCGAHCPKKTTPVYRYRKNCRYGNYSHEAFFCTDCHDALESSDGLFDVCEQIADVESDRDYAKSNGIQIERAEYALKNLRTQMHSYIP